MDARQRLRKSHKSVFLRSNSVHNIEFAGSSMDSGGDYRWYKYRRLNRDMDYKTAELLVEGRIQT